MNIRKLLAFLLCLMLTLPCAAEQGPLVVTDMMGREIALDAPATKIVALTAADCEILYAIGAGDTLIGRGEYCNYPAEVTKIVSVESGYETNVEQILALNPQAVLMSTMAQPLEHITALENAGIKVIESTVSDIAGVYAAIEMIGKVTGKDAEAARLIASMRDGFSELLKDAAKESGKTVYFEVSPLMYGLWTAGSGTFMDEIAGMLGLTNAFSDVAGWGAISEEQVLARDPDYIVTISGYYGEGPTPVEEILSRAGWNSLKAVQNGTVYNVDADAISRPGPRLLDAARALNECIR